GVSNGFLSSTYLASNAPVLIAPAMNTTMWENPATQRNIEQLKKDGVHFVEPIAGELACKTVGTGKLEDVENIVAQALRLLVSSSKFQVPSQSQDSDLENTTGNFATQQPETWNLKPGTQDLLEEKILIT